MVESICLENRNTFYVSQVQILSYPVFMCFGVCGLVMLFCLVLGSSWYLIFLTSTTLWFYIWAEVPFSLVTLVDCIGESYFFYSDALFFTPSTSWLSDLVDIILGLFFVFIGLTFYRVLLRMQWFGLVYLCGNLFFFF